MRIEKQKDQLHWFNLKNYDSLKNMSEVEWLDQLLIRKHIIDLISTNVDDIPKDIFRRIKFFVETITKFPIIDFKSPSFIQQFGKFKTFANDFDEFWNWNSNLGIHQITLEEAMRSIRGIDDESINQINSYLDSNQKKENNIENLITAQDFFSYSLDSMKNDYVQHLTLMVDISFPDELLVDQFAAQLKIYRKKMGSKNPRASETKNFNREKLIRFGVIPYIDIVCIWGELNKLNKSQAEIADLITSQDNAWTTSNLRTSTIPWVEDVLSPSFLNNLSINAQIKNLKSVI